jgi:hypothetical protein
MRKHLSPGMILGVIAVVFACSGSAFAGSLITSGKIKDGTIRGRDIKKGTITASRLATSVQKQLAKAGTPGPTGATGAPGSTTTVQGSAPQKGDKGETGAAGLNGANPATLVAKSGDADWNVSGGTAGNATNPQATLSAGWLHLQGGFDNSTPQGAIGIAHAYNNVALNTLKSISYNFRVTKRPAGNSVSAPTIHVFVTGVNTTDNKTFTNLVYEPYMNGDFGVNQIYSVDATGGKWWSTHPIGGISQNTPGTWADVLAAAPNAKIGQISLDNGGSSGANTIPGPEFQADADNLVVGFGNAFDRFDFGG